MSEYDLSLIVLFSFDLEIPFAFRLLIFLYRDIIYLPFSELFCVRMKSFCLSAWPSSFLSYALGCGADRVLTLMIFVFLLELPLRFPLIALADCLALSDSIRFAIGAPGSQR